MAVFDGAREANQSGEEILVAFSSYSSLSFLFARAVARYDFFTDSRHEHGTAQCPVRSNVKEPALSSHNDGLFRKSKRVNRETPTLYSQQNQRKILHFPQ